MLSRVTLTLTESEMAMARAVRSMEERTEAIVRRFVREIVNAGNYDVADELFAEDYVRHDPTIPEEQRGPRDSRRPSRVPDRVPRRRGYAPRVLVDGEYVAFRATETGSHEDEFMGIEPTGRDIEMEGTV